ncbi:MAG TPA: RNA 2',3'-cyclic phosphodiesterase [Salinivirgaceae bacterium]|nr:RNA 2',3'-cyclic phosphodiesterase [Salinivirgaceae bacterium]
MRTFIAIDIPVNEELKMVLLDIKQSLSTSKINWVDFSTLHLTIAFLGDTQNSVIQKLQADFENSINEFGTFQLKVANVGYFGPKVSPTVIWVGVEPSEQLVKLHKVINDIVAQHKIQYDFRAFKPHVTIGRIKQLVDNNIINNLSRKYRNKEFQTVLCDKVIMYQSILTPKGAIYKPLFEQNL